MFPGAVWDPAVALQVWPKQMTLPEKGGSSQYHMLLLRDIYELGLILLFRLGHQPSTIHFFNDKCDLGGSLE